MSWYGGLGFGWLGALVAMVLFWGGLFAAVAVVLRRFTSGSFRRRSAEELLAEWLARGEIDEAEYTRLRDIVRSR
jgi:putative membrane protein